MSTHQEHKRNATTWFTLATTLMTMSIVVGGALIMIPVGVVCMALGAVSYRRAKQTAPPAKPKLKTRLKRGARKRADRARRGGRDFVQGRAEGGRAAYVAREKAKPSKNNRPPKKQVCNARCQRSRLPAKSCDCTCRGRDHGKLAGL